jgi:hypothetical protein
MTCCRRLCDSTELEFIFKLYDHYKEEGHTDILLGSKTEIIKSWISNGRFEGHVNLMDPKTNEQIGKVQLNARMKYPGEGAEDQEIADQALASSAIDPSRATATVRHNPMLICSSLSNRCER